MMVIYIFLFVELIQFSLIDVNLGVKIGKSEALFYVCQVEVVEGVAGEEDHHDDQEEQGEENPETEGQHDEHDEDGETQSSFQFIILFNCYLGVNLTQQSVDHIP